MDRMDADREAFLRDVRAEEILAQRPVCEECGMHIREDRYYLIGGKRICPDCLEDYIVYID